MSKPTYKQRWWKADAKDLHSAVFSLSADMELYQSDRRGINLTYLSLFNAKGSGVSMYGERNNMSARVPDASVMTTNVIRIAVDVLGNKVAKGKPKASFVTNGGTWAEQRRAMRLDRFVYGAMHAANFYSEARLVFRDAAVMDLGALKGCVSGGSVVLQRVDPNDIKVDVTDGYNGRPDTLVHSQVVSRDTAHAWVEDWHADKSEAERQRLHDLVDKASSGTTSRLVAHRSLSFGDVVQVEEAWHLPTRAPDAKGKHDGRHVVALSNFTMLDEPATFFPFAFCRVVEPFNGFYGQGLAELLLPHQQAINGMNRRYSAILKKLAVARIYMPSGSKASFEQMAGDDIVMTMTGNSPPVMLQGSAVPPELWSAIQSAKTSALEQVGISLSAVSATKPAGLNSGAALRDYQDIESQRHVNVHLAYEDFVLNSARLVVNLARKASDDGEELVATLPRYGRGADTIAWDEVAADESAYRLQVFSTSNLPTTPAARKQYVEELRSNGEIDGREARRLLDMPDTDASDNLALSSRDAVDFALERMLDGDTDEGAEEAYTPPEPFDDLAYCMSRGAAVYHAARVAGAPEARLAMVRQYIMSAEALLKSAQPPEAAPPGPGATPDVNAQPGPAEGPSPQ